MYDVIIIGLGVYGSAVAAEAATTGLTVLAVDRYAPAHSLGSSHGASRIFRLTTVESEDYVALAQRAGEIWKSYDAQMGGSLLVPAGFALIGDQESISQTHHGVSHLVDRASGIARRHSIQYECMLGADVMRLYPALQVSRDAKVFYEPGAFVIRPEIAVKAFVDRAVQTGRIDLLIGDAADSVVSTGQGVTVTVAGQEFHARQAVLATGPWQHESLIGRNPIPALVKPQITLRLPSVSAEEPGFPGFVYTAADKPLVYGVPGVPGIGETKFGIEQDSISIDQPDPRLLPQGFVERIAATIRSSAHSVVPSVGLEEAEPDLCYYTVTPDSRHIIRRVDDRVTLVSACSGHGFKYAPALAEKIVSGLRRRD